MKSTPSLPVIGAMLAALGAIAIATWIAWSQIAREQPVTGGAAVRASITIGGPFELVDHRGETVTEASFRGRYMLVYFGYGYCPDVCPTELANIAAALDHLGEQASLVQPLFITIDPERDTATFLADYVKHFHPRLVGLTGTPEQIKQAAKVYRVFYAKSKSAEATEYLMDHSTFVYLMGPEGQYLSLFRRQTDPKEIAATIARAIADAPAVSLKSP